jgi:hypothetical protein
MLIFVKYTRTAFIYKSKEVAEHSKKMFFFYVFPSPIFFKNTRTAFIDKSKEVAEHSRKKVTPIEDQMQQAKDKFKEV